MAPSGSCRSTLREFIDVRMRALCHRGTVCIDQNRPNTATPGSPCTVDGVTWILVSSLARRVTTRWVDGWKIPSSMPSTPAAWNTPSAISSTLAVVSLSQLCNEMSHDPRSLSASHGPTSGMYSRWLPRVSSLDAAVITDAPYDAPNTSAPVKKIGALY